MQGKGIVKFFLVVMLLVCAVQILYIFPTNKVENDAIEFARNSVAGMAEGDNKVAKEKASRVAYLDSMSTEKVFSIPLIKDFTYQELKSRELALGLDLKGGMSVVLQVDLKDLLVSLSNNSKDPVFTKVLASAEEAQKTSQIDFISLFSDTWNAQSGGKKLSSIFIHNEGLRDEINTGTSDGEVARILREKADQTVDLTFKRLKERIDKLGVVQPNISLDKTRDLIVVELPGIDNPERARTFLQAAAKLEFWDTYRCNDPGVIASFEGANRSLKTVVGDKGGANANIRVDTIYNATDELGNTDSSRYVLDTVNLGGLGSGPLFSVLNLNRAQGFLPLAVLGTADKNKKDLIDGYLKRPEVKNLFPKDMMFRWSKDPIVDKDNPASVQYELYGIKSVRGSEKAPLEGDHVVAASASPDQKGEVSVSLKMDSYGARKWGRMTENAANNNNREIAIILDDEVVSAPRVNGAILGGTSSITGGFSLQEGKDLANILQVGKLPARTRIVQESNVGPTLGQDNINRSVRALVVGFLIVLAFMLFYYAGAGVISVIALLLNVVFIFGALASFGTVLTLPGIAGIVLTIGMAVDANVIIFERIREEMRIGKSVGVSLKDGFVHSYSAIIDANVTTLLVAFVLIYFGLGPIKGFAVVLAIGVVSSVFTSVLVGRLMFDKRLSKRGSSISFWTGPTKNAFTNFQYDWIGKKKMAWIISGIVLLISIGSIFTRGFELGVDFKGGYSYNVEFDKSINVDQEGLKDALTAAFGERPIVKAVDGENTYNVTTSYNINSNDENAAELVIAKLHEGVSSLYKGTSLKHFSNQDGHGTHITSSSKVGPTIADDISKSARYATIFALLIIFVYIFIRFSKWEYSAGAVAALFHDTIIVLGIFSLFHGVFPFSMEIDQAFIAAILTVIGYSINDTVVVFDRVREYLGLYSSKSNDEIINNAINSTLSRTVITSLTTLFVVLILFLFGGGSIKGFAFALLIGIVVGTYSSLFIATPLMAHLVGDEKPGSKKGKSEKKKHFSKAYDA